MALSAALGLSATAAILLAWHGPLDRAFASTTWPLSLNVGVYFDSLSAVMLLLISFIGLIIGRYSVRYLDGEANQGRFLRWMSVTLGAVLLLVVSRNLVMFTAAWMLTSFGLHQLLIHYPDRTWAIWAARKKFLISRLGDLFLLVALGLTYSVFGSFDYRDIFAAAKVMQSSPNDAQIWVPLIGMLYVFGAMTKSAQFPFHSWLPDTMETPTPVSALMHAGVINAGGFLVIRLSPLVSLSHLGLDLLAWVGAFTALFAAVVMLTQTSVKRCLAYSTIAQMGFMMLQCGLGAFSAALLHIVAHSLYKAHYFLVSGSVLDSAAALRVKSGDQHVLRGGWALTALPAAFVIASGMFGSVAWLSGLDLASKPGVLILGMITVVAVTQLIWHGLLSGSGNVALRGIGAAWLVCCGYFAAYLLVDRLIAQAVPHQIPSLNLFDAILIGFVAAGFWGVFLLPILAERFADLPAMRSLYVHAANGFYLDVPARRVTARVWGSTTPTP